MSSIGLLIKIELIHEIKFTFEDVIIAIIRIKLLNTLLNSKAAL